ncbi:MAG: COX15/CtaA family protein [Caldilineaceae bacterium]|nr:COX15/CtaA family protein [Caldilineaceae bacterium]
MNTKRFASFAWGVLGFNILVVLWGAVVRATGSGAGCGSHWPLCQGELVPREPAMETLIELSHRLTSGLALISVVILLIWSWRLFPKGHIVRQAAFTSMFFMIVEALLGAGLVLFEYVAFNQSIARAYWMAGHLVNTFLLLAAIALTAWWASGYASWQWRGQGAIRWLLGLAWLAMLMLGVSGAVTALGDTLAITGQISPTESTLVAQLVALRIYHPLLAIGMGVLLVAITLQVMARRPSRETQRWGRLLIGVFVAELLIGAVNVALKAPVWLQIVHLFAADLIWLSLVLLTAAALAVEQPVVDSQRPAMVEQPTSR